MPHLFRPLTLRSVTLRNRIGVSPMCMYSAADGFANDWHLVHLGSRAVGGAGLVIVEATAVEPRGRISPEDLGIWDDAHVPSLARIADFLHQHGAVPGIQLGHAGRKAGVTSPWQGGAPLPPERAWTPVAPSALPFDEGYLRPEALTKSGIDEVVHAFASAAKRALRAGFRFLEIHAAHGYLIHEFLSPLTNERKDEYGGGLENRLRFLTEVVKAVREVWPPELPLSVRISATDWVEGGWDLEQSVACAQRLKGLGVDLVDCSSGGAVPRVRIPVGPGYQVPFAERIRNEAGIATAAVGMITEARQAEEILAAGKADLILMAREFLRRPYWPHHAARELGAKAAWPNQYLRGVQ